MGILVDGRMVIIRSRLVGLFGCARGARRRKGRAGQATQLPGPVQPDEDLAEQPLEPGGFAPGGLGRDDEGYAPRRPPLDSDAPF